MKIFLYIVNFLLRRKRNKFMDAYFTFAFYDGKIVYLRVDIENVQVYPDLAIVNEIQDQERDELDAAIYFLTKLELKYQEAGPIQLNQCNIPSNWLKRIPKNVICFNMLEILYSFEMECINQKIKNNTINRIIEVLYSDNPVEMFIRLK